MPTSAHPVPRQLGTPCLTTHPGRCVIELTGNSCRMIGSLALVLVCNCCMHVMLHGWSAYRCDACNSYGIQLHSLKIHCYPACPANYLASMQQCLLGQKPCVKCSSPSAAASTACPHSVVTIPADDLVMSCLAAFPASLGVFAVSRHSLVCVFSSSTALAAAKAPACQA